MNGTVVSVPCRCMRTHEIYLSLTSMKLGKYPVVWIQMHTEPARCRPHK